MPKYNPRTQGSLLTNSNLCHCWFRGVLDCESHVTSLHTACITQSRYVRTHIASAAQPIHRVPSSGVTDANFSILGFTQSGMELGACRTPCGHSIHSAIALGNAQLYHAIRLPQGSESAYHCLLVLNDRIHSSNRTTIAKDSWSNKRLLYFCPVPQLQNGSRDGVI